MSAKAGLTTGPPCRGLSKNEGTEEELLAKADDAFVSSLVLRKMGGVAHVQWGVARCIN